MVMYEHLPIYKASYDLTLQLFHVIKRFPKDLKYTLWEQIKKDSLLLISSIYKANVMKERRKELLQECRSYLESNKILLRISKDLHVLPLDKFVIISQSIEIISKQLVGRERSVGYTVSKKS